MSTNNNSPKPRKKINLIPLFILIGLIVIIYFVFLSNNDLFKINKKLEVRRLNGFPTVAYTDKYLEKHRDVITNEEELIKFLNYVDESGYLTVREDIDFSKEMLIGVSTDTNDTSGVSIKIKKLYEDKDSNTLLVSIRETEPGKTCEVEENKNVAVDLVAIDITDMKVDFERVKEVKECN
jgi:hypothetical protein